ncbi:MAG: hypothetical protein CMJ62_20230 [Planctomycetaceae bacterium]|nr:hypothetical protein [Planctomycetaceae bacterium]
MVQNEWRALQCERVLEIDQFSNGTKKNKKKLSIQFILGTPGARWVDSRGRCFVAVMFFGRMSAGSRFGKTC